MKHFQHQRLDTYSDSIRLLQLEQVRLGDEEVRCRIFHTTLSECPAYYALSYTWGSEHEERYIFVDGSRHKVRANLWSFLKQAQDTLPYSILWIDALCIDQQSNEERGHQVQLMGNIYSKAEKVIVWLGNEGVSISHLFWLFADTAENLIHLTPGDVQAYIRTIYMLAQFPYWSRMWVVQELLLASTIDLMYNDDLLPWDLFWTGIDSLLALSSEHDVPGSNKYSITHSYAYRHREQREIHNRLPKGGKSAHLNGLLARYSSLQCTLIRDRVVGLLSLVERGDSFKDSYHDTVANLALRAFLHFRENLEVLGRLRQCLRITHARLYEELASWQPSRISSTYSDANSYRGEMVRFEVGYGYEQNETGLKCKTCDAVVDDIAPESLLHGTLYCLAGMGTSRHLFCAPSFSEDGQISSYAMFFVKQINSLKKHTVARFRPRSEGILAVWTGKSQHAWLYISIDLFVYLAEYLALPELDWTAPVPPTKTLMPIPKSALATTQTWKDRFFPSSRDPVANGDIDLAAVDLLVPAKDGRDLQQWFDFRKVRPKFRRFLEHNVD